MKGSIFAFTIITAFILQSCELKTANEFGLHFSTEKSKLPDTLKWMKIGFAKELINQKEIIVVISGGKNQISMDKWDEFKPSLPYRKNIDRHLLFQQTAFYRSPNTDVNCEGAACMTEHTYKSYSWIELAKPICIDYVGGKTDILKPEKGRLVIKTIQKCKAIMFTDSIFQLTDGKGNFYVMHATENGKPDTKVILPLGWTLKKMILKEPLIISPFGGGNDCFYNILGDNLGQGYHQYIFTNKFYPANEK